MWDNALMKQKVSMTLDENVVAELQKMADQQGITLSYLVNNILKSGLDSMGELIKALDGMSLADLIETLMEKGKKKKK